jgi:hypothetical protein
MPPSAGLFSYPLIFALPLPVALLLSEVYFETKYDENAVQLARTSLISVRAARFLCTCQKI